MFSFLKKLISALLVLYGVALILNLKVGGKPTREWTAQAWNNASVQKIYRGVRDRILALVRKDISVEEVFQSEIPTSSAPAPAKKSAPEQNPTTSVKTINLEKLDDKDRQALEKILDKAAQ